MAKMTLDELRALREAKRKDLEKRDVEGKDIQIIVGMGTCGIAAGAREVMSAVLDEVTKRQLNNVTVHQTGCIGSFYFFACYCAIFYLDNVSGNIFL